MSSISSCDEFVVLVSASARVSLNIDNCDDLIANHPLKLEVVHDAAVFLSQLMWNSSQAY